MHTGKVGTVGMPPKSASTGWPPRKYMAKPSESIPDSVPKSNSPAPSATTASAVRLLSSTAIPASPEPSRKTLPTNSPTTKSAPQKSPRPSTLSQTQFDNSGKTLDSYSGFVKNDARGTSGNDNNAYTVTTVEPERTSFLKDGTVVGSGDGDINAGILSSVPVTRPHGQDERSIDPTAGPESGGSGVTGSGIGKRKIVKRTVRVVKKVIKKRVPKRVLIEGSENQEKFVEETGNDVVLSDVTENLNLKNDAVENSNIVGDVLEKYILVNEVKDKSNIVDELKKTSNLNIDARVSEPISGVKDNDTGVIKSIYKDNLMSNDVMTALDRTECMNFTESMKNEKVSSVGESTMESDPVEGMEDPVIEQVSSVGGSTMESDPVKGMEDPVIEKVSSASENTTESEETKGNGLAKEDGLKENRTVDTSKNEDVGLGSVSFSGDQNGTLLGKPDTEKEGSSEKVNQESESNSVWLNECLLMRGEMEALERKKRRKTEIFVGGLRKEAQKDDIRKVFEGAGEIVEVRLVKSSKMRKSKGFAFVRFATAADAKNALAKYSKVEICGKQCGAAPVEGNDTIFLGNIDKTWKTEDVVKLLEKAGIEKIDEVTLKTDPTNMENNRGFAFVELETSKAAQIAFRKLQKKDVFGKNLKVNVAWALPLIEPSEEEILRVKSVYAEFLPSSWDEERVKEYFKRFGEIENVILAKDLSSSRRKDFAFINYTAREAALACIEAFSRERVEDDGSKAKIVVSLANPIPKGKQKKLASDLTGKQFSQEKPRASQATIKLHEPGNKGKSASSSNDGAKVASWSSTTDELVQILRQQASSKHIPPRPIIGAAVPEHQFPLLGSKRRLSPVEIDQLYLEPRGLPRARMESSYLRSGSSALFHGVGMTSFPYHHNRPGPDITSELINGRNIYPSHFQTREQAPYHGNSDIYRRY